jgi:hypothetical protein
MEPVYYVSYYLELQKQLAASKGSSQKPLREVPADQELNSLPFQRFSPESDTKVCASNPPML